MIEIIKKIICFLTGHKIVPMLVEDECTIYVKGCKRCNCGIGMPYWKAYDCPPPPRKGQSKDAVREQWIAYVDSRCEEIRKSVNILNQ